MGLKKRETVSQIYIIMQMPVFWIGYIIIFCSLTIPNLVIIEITPPLPYNQTYNISSCCGWLYRAVTQILNSWRSFILLTFQTTNCFLILL